MKETYWLILGHMLEGSVGTFARNKSTGGCHFPCLAAYLVWQWRAPVVTLFIYLASTAHPTPAFPVNLPFLTFPLSRCPSKVIPSLRRGTRPTHQNTGNMHTNSHSQPYQGLTPPTNIPGCSCSQLQPDLAANHMGANPTYQDSHISWWK